MPLRYNNRNHRNTNTFLKTPCPPNDREEAADCYDPGCGMVPMHGMWNYAMNSMSLASAYVVPQIYRKAYPPTEALKSGTVFPELFIPYMPDERPYR